MLRVQVDGLPVCHCRDWKAALAAGDEELCHPVVLSTARAEGKTESVRSWTGQYEVPLPWDISPVSIADRHPMLLLGTWRESTGVFRKTLDLASIERSRVV